MNDNEQAKKARAYKDELKLQTDLFVEAIQKSMNETAAGLGRPIMTNAMASAIVIMAGETLALIPPGKDRNTLKKAMIDNLGKSTVHARGRFRAHWGGGINIDRENTIQ